MKMCEQQSLFRDAVTGEVIELMGEPYQHQISRSRTSSALSLAKVKAKGFHITQKNRIKAFLLRNQGSTLDEISAGTGIIQHGSITARFEDLRKSGYDLLNNHGKWLIKKRPALC